MKMRMTVGASALLTAVMSLSLYQGCGGDSDEGGMGGAGPGDGISFGGDFGDGDGDGDGDGQNLGCGEAVEAAPLEANALFVIDTSESMKGTPDGFSESKWDTLTGALDVALPEVQSLLGMGVKFFPSGSQCGVSGDIEVPIATGADGASGVLEALSLTPTGGTPTAAALQEALKYFESEEGQALEGDKYVVLATDGGPNCNDTPTTTCSCPGGPDGDCGDKNRCTVNLDGNQCDLSDGNCCLGGDETLCLDDEATLAVVKDLADAGVQTIVLGMPGTEVYAGVLNSLAEAGGQALSGTEKYVRVEDAAELEDALRSVTRNLIRSCEIQLGTAPRNPLQVNLYLDGEVIAQDEAGEDGWIYPDRTDFSLIELVGPTCTRVEQEGVEKIAVESGCETVVR